MNKDRIFAYDIIKEENLKDIRSTGYLLRHKKTGARVMLIENDDENKVCLLYTSDAADEL